jgi:tRNA G18 (ribose-2'-O)-methylase SpoU
MNFSLIRDPLHEDIAPFSDLKLPRTPGIFIAEGEKVVRSLLESGVEIGSIYLTEEHFLAKSELIRSHMQSQECKIILDSKQAMEEIVGFSLHQGILAAAKIPGEKKIDQIVAETTKPLLFVILDGITDAENMGSLYRTSAALGATAVICGNSSISPWIRRAVRVSLGAVFNLPTIFTPSLSDTIAELRSRGILVYAATLNPNAQVLWESDLSRDVAFVFGSEGHGIKREIVSACSSEVTIPMPEGTDSLNVSVAQGLFLYEALRRKGMS